MDINEGVPLPKKLTTPLPELPKMIPPSDAEQGVELPKKLTTPLPDKPERAPDVQGAFRPLPTRDNLSEFDRQLKASAEAAAKVDAQLPEADRNRKYVPLAPPSIRLEAVVIKRPVEESARLAGSGFDLEKIKKDAEQKAASRFETPMELPPKIRALGNREEKVFEPAGSSIPTFVASENTQIKLKSLDVPKTGTLSVAKCGVEFEAPKIGQPMMRRVRIVWPTPMEKAPTQAAAPFKGVGDACKLQGMKPDARAFPGQTLPEGAQPVELLDQGAAKVQVPMPKRPEPSFAGLQSPPRPSIPPRLGPRSSEGEGRPSIDEILAAAQKQVEGLIAKTAGSRNVNPADILAKLADRAPESVLAQIATRAQAIMSREAKAKDLETENAALREIVKTLGGKVALYEAELQILKAKKG